MPLHVHYRTDFTRSPFVERTMPFVEGNRLPPKHPAPPTNSA
jgi:hypothetical protein